jgi:hypothetical protein
MIPGEHVMSGRKHADLWKELVDEAGEDEIDRAATVSVAQAAAELTAAGFDVAAERAKAGAFVEALGSGVSSSPSRETAPRVPEPTLRKGPRARVLWLAAAAAFAAVLGGALYATVQSPPPVGHAPPPPPSDSATVVPSAEDLAVAAELRHKAAAACDAKQWSVCLAELDDARAVDPEGDDDAAVKSLRDKAMAGTGGR